MLLHIGQDLSYESYRAKSQMFDVYVKARGASLVYVQRAKVSKQDQTLYEQDYNALCCLSCCTGWRGLLYLTYMYITSWQLSSDYSATMQVSCFFAPLSLFSLQTSPYSFKVHIFTIIHRHLLKTMSFLDEN